jgi:hypothetical protein
MSLKPRTIGVLCVLAVGLVAWEKWDASESVIESRLVDRTARFLEALRAKDLPRALKLTEGEGDPGQAAQDIAAPAVSGTFKLDSASSVGEGVGRSFWDPVLLALVAKHTGSAVSYSLNLDPDTPSIALNFDCSRATDVCLEHLKIFYSPRARKISRYVTLWNNPDWREIWDRWYSKGLITRPCDSSCPFR